MCVADINYKLDAEVFGVDSTDKIYVTDHAAERWMKYTGQQNLDKAKNVIRKQLFLSEPIEREKVKVAYAEVKHGKKARYFKRNKTIFVMVDKRIVTTYPYVSSG